MLYLIQDKNGDITMPPHIWTLIKDFAGIYNISTKWSKLKTLPLYELYECYDPFPNQEWMGTGWFNPAIVNYEFSCAEKKIIMLYKHIYLKNEDYWRSLFESIATRQFLADLKRLRKSKWSVWLHTPPVRNWNDNTIEWCGLRPVGV